MSRKLISFGLQLFWLVAACDSGGLQSHRDQVPPDPVPPDQVARLSFTTVPTAVIAGNLISPAVVVTVLDEHGDTMTSAGTSVTLALGNNPGGGALVGTVTVPAVYGVAIFSNLYLLFGSPDAGLGGGPGPNTSGTGYTLVAEASGLGRVTSSPFKVTLRPDKLVFQVQPNPTAPGEAIAPPVRVAVLDVEGYTVEAANMSVTLALDGGTLGGNVTAPMVNGVASFPNLLIDKPGKGYTLTASAGGGPDMMGLKSVTSRPFTVGGFSAISAGWYTCGIDLAGLAYCWGGSSVSTPPAMAGGLTFASVSVGSLVGCGLTAAGAASCWGHSFDTTPDAVPGGFTFAAVSGSCGVTSTGAAYCWGSNYWGQLGNGSAGDSNTPVAVAGGLTFASVTAGDASNCGVTTAGEAYCWGFNVEGQFEDGWGEFWSTTPVAVPGGLTFATVSAGSSHRCGVTPAGAAYCWGFGYLGQLGNGSTETYSSTPVAVAGGLTFASVSAGGEHSCGLTTAGVAYCWGSNVHGELGNDSTTDSSTPVTVAGGHNFASLSAGTYYTCGVTTAGAAYCWGNNVHGELGNGSLTNSSTPVPVATGLMFASVSAGTTGYSCGVTTSGAAYCWGDNSSGELGDGSLTNSNTPVAVATGQTFTSVSAEAFYSCGMTTAGAAYCWGGDLYFSTPVALPGEITFTALSAGGAHSCGVTNAGVAYCWGLNGSGALGNGSTTNSNEPVVVAGGLTFATVSAGNGHSCGVTTSGAAYCWGANHDGQLGNGSATDSNIPVAVAGGLTFAAVSAGHRYSCGVTTAGAAYCWGYNHDGQLGDGSTEDSNTPVAVAGGLTFATVSAEVISYLGFELGHHSCGVTTTGAAYCWGNNDEAQLGDGTLTDRRTPVAVVGGFNFASLSAGGGYSCGLTIHGAAYCWGRNGSNAVGTSPFDLVPVRVPIP